MMSRSIVRYLDVVLYSNESITMNFFLEQSRFPSSSTKEVSKYRIVSITFAKIPSGPSAKLI